MRARCPCWRRGWRGAAAAAAAAVAAGGGSAEAAAEEGRARFSAGDFEGALEAFGRALGRGGAGGAGGGPGPRARLLCNRALCYARLERWAESLAEADAALEAEPRSEKGLFRRAAALEGLGRPGPAAEALGALLAIYPSNAPAAAALRRLRGGAALRLEKWKARLEGTGFGVGGAGEAFGAAQDLWPLLEVDCLEPGRATTAVRGGLAHALDSAAADEAMKPEAVAAALRSLTALASSPEGAEQLLSVLSLHAVAAVLLGGAPAAATAPGEAHGPLVSPALEAARLLGSLAAGAARQTSRESVEVYVQAAAPALAGGIGGGAVRRREASACAQAAAAAGGLPGFFAAFGACAGWVRILEMLDVLDEVLVRRLFQAWWGSEEGPTETRAWFQRDVLPVLSMSASSGEDAALNAFRALNAACAGNLQLGAWCMQQNGVLEGVLASLSAPGSSAALREGASTLLLHVSSGRAGMAIFERSEVTEAFSEALLECGDCTVRATLVAVLAKLAANSDSPSERLSLFDEAVAQISGGGLPAGDGALSERDLGILSRQVEAMTVLSSDCAIKDRLAELCSERGSGAPGAGLDLERLGVACCRDPSLRFGLAHIVASMVASAEEKEHEALMSSSGEDEEQAERRELQKALVAQDGPGGATGDEADPEAPARRKWLFLQGGGGRVACRLARGASVATQRLAAACLFHVAGNHRCRPYLVQQGAIGCLLGVAGNGDDASQKLARHALARIFISVDPKLVPEGLALSAVPLLVDLAGDEYVLQQFEACLALTNLALLGDSVASIVMDRGWDSIQNLLYSSSHKRLRVAATELVANCALNERVLGMFRERGMLKVWLAMADEPADFGLCRASATALAMLAQVQEMAVPITEEGGVAVFCRLAATGQPELVWRALEGLRVLLLPGMGGGLGSEPDATGVRELPQTLRTLQRGAAGAELYPPQVPRLAEEILGRLETGLR